MKYNMIIFDADETLFRHALPKAIGTIEDKHGDPLQRLEGSPG